MTTRQLVMAAFVAALILMPLGALAQPPAASTFRTAWGDPDISGIFDYSSITPMQRPTDLADQEYLTEEQAAALEQGAVNRDIAAAEAPVQRSFEGDAAGANIHGCGGLISAQRSWRTGGRRGSLTRRTAVFRP